MVIKNRATSNPVINSGERLAALVTGSFKGGTFQTTFRAYDVPTGGMALWKGKEHVAVTRGGGRR